MENVVQGEVPASVAGGGGPEVRSAVEHLDDNPAEDDAGFLRHFENCATFTPSI